MECPLCHTTVPEGSRACTRCGVDFSVLDGLQAMRLDLQQAGEESASLARQLYHLQERFEALMVRLDPPVAPSVLAPAAANAPAAQEPAPAEPDAAPSATPIAPASADTEVASGPSQSDTEIRLGQKWLLVVGVAITVLGIGFFLKYAFDQNWVGPAGRITLAYCAAMAFLGAGESFRRRATMMFGLYLIGGGIAVLYVTTFAAFQLYSLFSQTTAFGFMVLVTVLAGLLALRYDTAWLAILGLIGGFLTPVILSTGRDNQFALMSYMVLLNAGILAIAAFKRWRLLNTLGFLLTWLLFTGWFLRHYSQAKFWSTLFFLHVFFLCYVFVPFISYFVQQSRARLTGLTLSFLNTFVTFAFAFGMIQEYTSLRLVSLVTLSYAGLFLGMATMVYRRQQETLEPFILLVAKGTLFLILTVPILFSGHWITLFWAVQSVILLWAGIRLRHHWLCSGALVLLLLTVGKFVLYDTGEVFQLRLDYWRYVDGFTPLLLERWSTAAIVLGALLYSARALGAATPGQFPWQKAAAEVLYGTFAILLFLALTVEVSTGFYVYALQARFAAISVLWALFSLALMVLGFLGHRAVLRLCALGLFAVTVLKVFLVDMASASTPFRIISFVVLGLLLIGASYLYYCYRDQLLSGEPPGEAR